MPFHKLARIEECLRGGFHLENIKTDDQGIHVVLATRLMRLTVSFSREDAVLLLFGSAGGGRPLSRRARVGR